MTIIISKYSKLWSTPNKLWSEWHPTKNNGLKPEDYSKYSHKKVWWKCHKGDDHEWQATIANRSGGKGCPFCSGRKVGKSNNLQTLNPELASEWHPKKNGDSKPEDFTLGSGKKVWWQCPKGEDHEWEASVDNRSNKGSGCPICAGKGTSKPEIRILCELRYLLGSVEVAWRSKKHGVEIDIFLSKYNIGIEYDGFVWHDEKLQSDIEKNDFLQKKGIHIIRVREHPLQAISINDVVVVGSLTKDDLNALILKIKAVLKSSIKINFDAYITNSSFLNEREFKRYISFLPSPPPEYSILKTNPEIAKQWHHEKNSPLKPENFTQGSGQKIWWKCPKGDDHEWQATIANRSGGKGCPFCSGRKVGKSNNLQTLNPELASEWHPKKNGDSKPEDFTLGSGKKVWWQCPKGEDHEWKATIGNRTGLGRGCPICAGQKVSKKNNLLARNPKVASEWHPTKNGDSRPEEFRSFSNKKVWWKCPKGEDHEWETTIQHRSNGTGCPFCVGKMVSKTNSLLALNSKLASEWHPSKNIDLKPEDFTLYSHKKVWWQCPRNDDHEWETTITNRSRGRGCPFCSGRRKSKKTTIKDISHIMI